MDLIYIMGNKHSSCSRSIVQIMKIQYQRLLIGQMQLLSRKSTFPQDISREKSQGNIVSFVPVSLSIRRIVCGKFQLMFPSTSVSVCWRLYSLVLRANEKRPPFTYMVSIFNAQRLDTFKHKEQQLKHMQPDLSET